jgi:Lar family restriction alleviation protein
MGEAKIPELRPCPFCGSKAYISRGNLYLWAKCYQCAAEGSAQISEAKAVNAWNTRDSDPEFAALTARAEAAESAAVEYEHRSRDADKFESENATLRTQLQQAEQDRNKWQVLAMSNEKAFRKALNQRDTLRAEMNAEEK